jgi:AbrB family looped-hinge helix DNA binding protein
MNMMNQPRIVGMGRLNEKSQVVIPKEAREILGVGPGDRLLITVAPFFKGLIIARPEDIESHLQQMISNNEKTIGAVRKKISKETAPPGGPKGAGGTKKKGLQ